MSRTRLSTLRSWPSQTSPPPTYSPPSRSSDRLGRAEFLTKYGYGEARSYFIKHDGRFYDSKAIVGVAHQVPHGRPLTPEDFSGGDATGAALLRRLGFMVSVPNPRWTWDEIVLACDLVREHDWRALDDNNSAVIELSDD